MRRTPPVVVHLQPQPAMQAVVAMIVALTASGLAAWALSHEPRAWPALLAIPIAAFWAWRAAAVLPRRRRCDGQAWWLAEPGQDDDTQVRLAVLIDLGAWLPLSRAQQPSWAAIRATLFAAPAGAAQR